MSSRSQGSLFLLINEKSLNFRGRAHGRGKNESCRRGFVGSKFRSRPGNMGLNGWGKLGLGRRNSWHRFAVGIKSRLSPWATKAPVNWLLSASPAM